jgi:hypothetical protein
MLKHSIGSLAALAAFAAPAVYAAPIDPVSAAFGTNVALPNDTLGTVTFDIDGDTTTDFSVFSNGVVVTLAGSGSTLISAAPVTFGATFLPPDATISQVTLISGGTPVFSTGYYGFSFVTGGATHSAWVSFDLSGATPLATAGGWQTVGNLAIVVGSPASPIPEPSTVTALAGAIALLCASGRRLRRSASAGATGSTPTS